MLRRLSYSAYTPTGRAPSLASRNGPTGTSVVPSSSPCTPRQQAKAVNQSLAARRHRRTAPPPPALPPSRRVGLGRRRRPSGAKPTLAGHPAPNPHLLCSACPTHTAPLHNPSVAKRSCTSAHTAHTLCTEFRVALVGEAPLAERGTPLGSHSCPWEPRGPLRHPRHTGSRAGPCAPLAQPRR
jgi:hypothetical protein